MEVRLVQKRSQRTVARIGLLGKHFKHAKWHCSPLRGVFSFNVSLSCILGGYSRPQLTRSSTCATRMASPRISWILPFIWVSLPCFSSRALTSSYPISVLFEQSYTIVQPFIQSFQDRHDPGSVPSPITLSCFFGK